MGCGHVSVFGQAMKKKFVGFGFGAIQTGLFLYEAQQSGNFEQLTVAEVAPEIVAAVRAAQGRFQINIAGTNGIERQSVGPVALYDPRAADERAALVEAVAGADELATALPSVRFYEAGGDASVVSVLADGLALRARRADRRQSILYAAENHNHAAEILEECLARRLAIAPAELRGQIQCLNTVIGKMSGIVADETQITAQGLARMTGNSGRCVLVETFNRILISKINYPGFRRGIEVFEERADLLPFEEAKLYGHNATHALLGYLARAEQCVYMADLSAYPLILETARRAFIDESGRALCRRHAGIDPLFTEDGYSAYAEDLLERMLNPFLRDAVERVVRDPRRKLGWDDRLIGAMRLALSQGIKPVGYAQGAKAALAMLREMESGRSDKLLLDDVWADARPDVREKERIMELLF